MTNNLNVCAEKIGLGISGTETKIQKIGCLTDDCEIRGEAGRQWISFSVLTVQFQNLGTERKIVYHWNILFRILSRPMCLFIKTVFHHRHTFTLYIQCSFHIIVWMWNFGKYHQNCTETWYIFHLNCLRKMKAFSQIV